jgi:hypothetical protein
MLQEHNRLKGFGLVLVEFGLIALVGIVLAVAEALYRRFGWATAYLGIAVNAVAVCLTVIAQRRRGDSSIGLRHSFARSGRETIRKEHPNLGRHTLLVAFAALVPFFLAAAVVAAPKGKNPA